MTSLSELATEETRRNVGVRSLCVLPVCVCCCCCCCRWFVVVVSATVCCVLFFMIFFMRSFLFAFSINDFSFTFIKQLRSQATHADTHTHTHKQINTRTHTHTLKDSWWEALSFTVCLFCFLLISFCVARSPPFGLQMPPKLQSNAVFISFTLSLSLSRSFCFSLPFARVLLCRRNCKLPHATLTPTALPCLAMAVPVVC